MGSDEREKPTNAGSASAGSRIRTLLLRPRGRRNWELLIGAVIVLALVLTALAVEVASLLHVQITPYNPIQQEVGPSLAPPSLLHLFGTDVQGRDLFSRVIAATPNALFVSLCVVAVALTVGLIIGSLAAFKGGLLDEGLMRTTDIFFALPNLILAMAIGLALGPGIVNMTLALAIIWWPPYARLARGEALKIAHHNYIEASRTSGLGTARTIFHHVIPNIVVTILVYATLDFGTVILVYSSLSYVGLSVAPPAPDLGQMVSGYQNYVLEAPWLPIFPGLAIALTVIGFSVFGDGLRDFLEVV